MLFSCELSYSRKQPGFSTTDRSMSSEIKQPSRSKASWLASSLSSPALIRSGANYIATNRREDSAKAGRSTYPGTNN
uniref:Uncharacterized protein n=1 Tax=Oryza meridionalis TaxID=40149 RepID=A0A0E0EJ21_9ORYZ